MRFSQYITLLLFNPLVQKEIKQHERIRTLKAGEQRTQSSCLYRLLRAIRMNMRFLQQVLATITNAAAAIKK